jgi:hypothetical protein
MKTKPRAAAQAAAAPKSKKDARKEQLRAYLKANRVRMAPIYMATSMPASGWVLHAADDGWKTSLAVGVGTIAWASAWGWAEGAWRFKRTLPTIRDRYMALTGAVAGSGIVTSMALTGGPTFGANPYWGLIAAWGGVYGTWWWRRAGRAPEVSTGGALPLTAEMLIWEQHVAKAGGAMPGSKLVEPEAVPGNGWTAIALAPPGEIASASPIRIASAYDTSPALVDLETFAHSPRRSRVRVMERNPLQKGSVFTSPLVLDRETGRATVGGYTDGDEAGYQFFHAPGSGASGVVHSFIVGTTGSGKSRFLDELLAIERHNGMISWVCDPQGGQSLPDWTEACDWFAPSAEDGYLMLLAAKRVVDERSGRYARMRWTDEKGRTRRGLKSFVPGKPDAILSITLEEAPALMQIPGAATLAADIGKMGRKCGVKLRLVAQVPNLDELGGKASLRAMLQSGNIILLRTDSSSSSRLALGNAMDSIDSNAIPKYWPDGSSTGGLGYISGPDGRSGMFRAAYLDDAYDFASTGQTNHLEPEYHEAAGIHYREAEARMQAHLNDEPFVSAADTAETVPAQKADTPVPAAAAATAAPEGTAKKIIDFLYAAGRPVARAVIAHKLGLTGPQVGMALKREKSKQPPLVVPIGHGAWIHASLADQYADAA